MKRKMLYPVLAALCVAAMPALAAYQVGDTVTDFTLPDTEGNMVSLYDFMGFAIVINFWTST